MKNEDQKQEIPSEMETSRSIHDNFLAITKTPVMMPLMLHCVTNDLSPTQAELYYGIMVVYARGVQEKHGAVHLASLGCVLSAHCQNDENEEALEELNAILVRGMIAARQFKTVDPITCTAQLRDDLMPAHVYNHFLKDDRYANFRETIETESPAFITDKLGAANHATLQQVISKTIEQLAPA